ncbi:MAG: EscD/YscD/HrpQ family type III secretion system periplasmic domain-containing protein [Cocleimonas sp.]
MINHYTNISLKVLKGINKGAIADFDSNYLTVGSSEDCDVILSGFEKEERFFEISLTDEELFIRVIHRAIFIDGIETQPAEKQLPYELYQLISFDDCCVAVGERESEWPEDTMDIEYLDARSKKKSLFSHLSNHVKNFSFPLISDTQKILLTFLSLILVGGVFLLNSKTYNVNEASQTKDVVAHSNLIHPVKIPLAKSKTNQEIDLDNAKNLAYGLLQTYGVNRIDLNFDSDGTLVAKGYVGSNTEWEKAKASILEDIDLVKEINANNVETFKERTLQLNTMLQQRGLKKNLKIKPDPENNRIVVSGQLTNASTEKWNDLKSTFNTNYSGYPAIKSEITDIESNLQLSIRGVSIGKTRYFTSKTGKRYMVGSNLGNGFRVLKIEIDKITLLYEGSEITIIYNKGSENKLNTI